MEQVNDDYNEIKMERNRIKKEIKLLEGNDIVKRYIGLKKLLNYSLSNEQYDLCQHVLVFSRVHCNEVEDNIIRRCGCIKCGLDESILDENREELSLNKKIMYDYLKNHNSRIDGMVTGNMCDLSLAQAMYSRIKDIYPNISDLKAIKYFEIALDNMRNIEVSKERKVSRAKRLSLGPKFNKWDAKDVCIKN